MIYPNSKIQVCVYQILAVGDWEECCGIFRTRATRRECRPCIVEIDKDVSINIKCEDERGDIVYAGRKENGIFRLKATEGEYGSTTLGYLGQQAALVGEWGRPNISEGFCRVILEK